MNWKILISVLLIFLVVLGAGCVAPDTGNNMGNGSGNGDNDGKNGGEYKIEPPTGDGVFLYTDKSKYEEGEIVKVTILNNSEEAIFYVACGPPTIFSYWVHNGKAIKQSIAIHSVLACANGETIEAGKSETYEWNLGTAEITPSFYKMGFSYSKNAEPPYEMAEIFSDEFEVMGEHKMPKIMDKNPPLEEGVHVYTDYEIYEEGQIVKITFENNTDESIYYYRECIDNFNPYFRENGEFKMLALAQAYCGAIPVLTELKPYEKVEFEWNQQAVHYEGRYEDSFIEGEYDRIAGIYKIGKDYLTKDDVDVTQNDRIMKKEGAELKTAFSEEFELI